MAKKLKPSEPKARLYPDAGWPQPLEEAARMLSESAGLGVLLVSDSVAFEKFWQRKPSKPWSGPGAPSRWVVLWQASPIDPLALLSWRSGLIEEEEVASYRVVFLPANVPQTGWNAWLNQQVQSWSNPPTPPETSGFAVGNFVRYVPPDGSAEMAAYDPSFVTMSPSGKMAPVLQALDECKRAYRKVIDKDVGTRRKNVHAVLDEALDMERGNNETEEDFYRRFSDVCRRLTNVIANNDFVVDRNCLPRVLLLGASGVGKTLIARYLAWRTSPGEGERVARPFKRVPLPDYIDREHDFEHDLFGYCKGAYTDAHRGSRGFLLERLGGVIFFDEIGDASPALQAKLLAFLDDYSVSPRGWVGDPILCPILIVAATNRPIDKWADEELENPDPRSFFRNDLYRRFNRVIHVPSLTERTEEIPFMIDAMLQTEAFNPSRKIRRVGGKALAALERYDYSRGNFRTLENILREACAQAVSEGREYIVEDDIVRPVDRPVS
ncbi:MAG: sigma 54-interacting transcriptional regulator [Acidobacteria bacterium]|nr:sigma 54-interacting transcriptional regulator [Acidobacteriota bacterium]